MTAARSGDTAGVSPGGGIWGTAEELLLVAAVIRHGTASWDSVAMEMQLRCPSSAAAGHLSPDTCRLRFRLIHRRFSARDDPAATPAAAEKGDGGGGGGEEEPDDAAAARWMEELRELRKAELRREVEQSDRSIGSLESKVKRLKEERETSISGRTKAAAVKEEEEKPVVAAAAAGNGSAEEAGGEDRFSGHEFGRSCKESNSSDPKRPGHDAAVKEEPAAGEVAVKEEASGESVAGTKEADAEKESSDVQSSASLSPRGRRNGAAGDDAAAEAASPSPSALPASESEPLLAFLDSVRFSKSGSVFERRLESQESAKYRGTIRRHVDLEMIRSKLEGGGPARYVSASEFYRDLLLLCANALVFFPCRSPEHAAAVKVRAFVSKHLSASLHQKDHAGALGKASSSAAGAKKPKADADIGGSLLEKGTSIIVCRKRSSIAKAAAVAAKDEKAGADGKVNNNGEEEKNVGTKDKAHVPRTNKSRGPARTAAPNQKKGKASESSAAGAKKSDRKGGGSDVAATAAANGVAKKRNAVDFLNRMNQNLLPSTERGQLLETLKLSAAATEQKKPDSKCDSQKETGSSGSGSKKATTITPPGRRGIGRPPKRAAVLPTPPPAKRAKDEKPSKKRGKK